MKTILHTIDTTGPGGAETIFIDLATRLPKQKYRSLVLIRGKGWVYEELCRRGVKPYLMDAKGSFNWRYLSGLAGLIKRENIDLIQSHLLGANVYCSLAGLITRRPVVATFHGEVDIGENERLKSLKFLAINTGSKFIVAVSEKLRSDILSSTSLRQDKARVIYNGIDTGAFQKPHSDALRDKYGWSKSDIIIGSLGNIRPAKGYQHLLRAAALLKQDDGRFRFVIAGQGKGRLYNDLLDLRDNLGLQGKLEFLGFQNDPIDYLSNLDMFLLSSTSEGFSIATIQAMSAGLPVIATRSGGPEEIITQAENGWLVEAGDPSAIANAIKVLSSDASLCARISANGKKHATGAFDISTMLEGYEKLYESVR